MPPEKCSQSGRFKNKIVTEITPASTCYRAEEDHQQYLANRGLGASCHT
jgi:peptide-methionine (S)-S-oxide reductase